MNKLRTLITIILSQITILILAQEAILPLVYNSALVDKAVQLKLKSTKKINGLNDTIKLPFVDDFSDNFPYPNHNFWLNDEVYINTTFSNDPITLGVATFDALDKNGKLYEAAINKNFKADSLVSKPIDLQYNSNDSIYLSFFYQQGGLGEIPDKQDSLVLEFYAPLQKKWHSVLQLDGDSVKKFRLAMVAITDTAFLHRGFQFKFTNYASLLLTNSTPGKSSNGDIWNLDYVYLDKERNLYDTIFRDAAIVRPVKSWLKDFESMPWNHFKLPSGFQKEMSPKSYLLVRNNDVIPRNINHTYNIYDVYGGVNFEPFDNAMEVDADTTTIFEADIPTLESESIDSALFRIKAFITTDANDRKQNDTSIYYQVFKNYYAYDDGSAEYGYGLSGEGTANAQVALKYNITKEDSLQAIDIFFNQTLNNENNQDFYLCVWNGMGKYPDSLYKSKTLKPLYKDGRNQFIRYFLDKPITVPTTFYIGWQQTTETFINIGIDFNRTIATDAEILVNYQGTKDGWEKSKYRNALMMRPVVGNSKDAHTGIRNETKTSNSILSIFPNPANDFIHFNLAENVSSSTIIRIYDMTGKTVLSQTNLGNTLNISTLKQGVYLVQITFSDGSSLHGKFIKSLK